MMAVGLVALWQVAVFEFDCQTSKTTACICARLYFLENDVIANFGRGACRVRWFG